jgi:amino acid transporter
MRGGDYHYLRRAFGKDLAFLFAWARMTVIPTGSIALLAFVFGDYASQLFRIGDYSPSAYAALVIIALTGLNVLGIRQGKRAQNLLTVIEVAGLVVIIIAGLTLTAPLPPEPSISQGPHPSGGAALSGAWGLALVFVLLTYGGWNEAAYISAELRGDRRNIMRALLWSLLFITGLYMLVNAAYLRGLGLSAMAGSEAVAADLMRRAGGERAAQLISVLIAISALTSANATILMGARTNYALGRDFKLFATLGRWDESSGSPVNALQVQAVIALALVLLGTLTRKGFETMVEYTAPAFWFFFLLTGLSLFVLRARDPQAERPFQVPFYPLLPMIFCAASGYLLYSSIAYTGVGALVSMAVLISGVPAALLARRP